MSRILEFVSRILATLTVANLGLATLLFVGFVGSLLVLRRLVPGRLVQGSPLPDGTRKSYRLNGLRLLAILALFLAVGQTTRLYTLATVNRLFWPLFVVANAWAFTFAGYLYLKGVRALRASGAPAVKRNPLAALWFGAELNPDLWGVDQKMFAYVPSLLGLWVINLSYAVVQWDTLGHLTTRMWLYQTFFTTYICNYFQFEYGMLHTWDVIAENFGLMLVWGDYVLVPFFYCLCGSFLVGYLEPLPEYEAAALILLFAVGFWLFRGANEQKHRYKENPNIKIWGKPAEAIGGRLLASGFWGIGRKLNYTGELMIYLSWALTTGFQSLVPFVLPLWLAVLFPHRAWRDEQRCSKKYGELWQAYCRRARFRMIPFVY